MKDPPALYVVTGVNRAGQSTLTESGAVPRVLVIDPDAIARRTPATRRRCRNGWRVQRDVALASGVDPKELEALVCAARGQDRNRDAGDDVGL